ncbi:MAG: putative TonB-dependent receptor protein [Firmicutes bacterium]|nr:putative TonB-dependent receptor protein [Bacillota bacterium]
MLKRWGKKKKAAVLAVSILGYLTNPAYAAEISDETVVKTRDVVVSATRTDQEVKEIPANVEVITREDIDTMGAETLAQALKLAVGIDVLENGMVGNTVSIRGMNNNQTLILINGRRIRTEDASSTANAYELQRVNMDNVEKIEIVRGAVSSLYGSEALGGVINIIMKKPDEAKTTLSLSSTSHQTDTSIRADFGKQGKWTWAMSSRATDVKKRTDNDATTNQYGDKYYFNLEGVMDLGENKELDIYYDVLKENLEGSTASTTKTDYDHTRTTYGTGYSGKDKLGDYEFRTYYTNFKKEQDTRLKSTGKLSDFDDMEFDSWITDGKRTMQVADNHLVTFGGEFRQEDYASTRINSGKDKHTVTKEGITNTMSKASLAYSAFYLQDEWIMSDKLLVIPSVRYDYSDQFGDKITSKLGSTYKLNDNSRFKFNVGSAYKAPTASELYMYMEHPSSTRIIRNVGNANLQPETSMNYDVSFEAEQGKNFGKVTYFKNDVDNLIAFTTKNTVDSTTGKRIMTNTYGNIKQAEINGIELEAGRHINDKLTVKATYVNLDAMNTTSDTRLEGRAKDKISLQFQYDDVKASGISAVLWNEWVSDYYQDAANYSYQMLNLSVNKKFSDKYSMYFGLDNLLDKKVEDLNIEGLIWRTGMTVSF